MTSIFSFKYCVRWLIDRNSLETLVRRLKLYLFAFSLFFRYLMWMWSLPSCWRRMLFLWWRKEGLWICCCCFLWILKFCKISCCYVYRTFRGGRKHTKASFSVSCWTWVWPSRNQLQENSPTFDILSELEWTQLNLKKGEFKLIVTIIWPGPSSLPAGRGLSFLPCRERPLLAGNHRRC